MTPRALPALLALLLLVAGQAAAHGFSIGGEPEPYAILEAAPSRVVVMMTEPVEPSFSHVRVLDADGTEYATGKPYSADGNTSRLGIDVGSLPNGTYTVAWEARWLSDGHDTKGTYGFALGNATLPADFGASGAANAFAGPDALEVFLRTTLFIGAFLAVGGILFFLIVDKGASGPRGAWRAQVVALAGAVGVALASLLLLLRLTAAGYDTSPGAALGLLARSATETQIGGVLAVRILVSGALALLLGITLRNASRMTLLAATGAALPLLPTLTFTSHAAAAGLGLNLPILVDITHVLAGAAWVGGLPLLAWGLRHAPADDAKGAASLATRFSRYAMLASAAVILTGVGSTLARLPGLAGLWTTPYGQVLVAKVGLVAILVGFGAWNQFVLIPRGMRRAARGWRRLSSSSGIEAAVAALVLLAAGALTGLAPAPVGDAAQTRGFAPFHETLEGEAMAAELTIAPYRLGVNQFVVNLTIIENGTALDYAKKVELFLNYRGDVAGDESLGASTLVLEHVGDGKYVARGSLGLRGEWSATVFVQRPDAYDDAATFTLQV